MNRSIRIAAITLALITARSLTWPSSHDTASAGEKPTSGKPAKAGAKKYVCPPCDSACHDRTFDEAGRCPVCNMRLREIERPKNVAILIWDGVEVLDFTGPAEVFAAARAYGRPAFNVYTVAPSSAAITSQGFITVTPNHTVANCPTPDIIVIPGGGTQPITSDEKTLEWIKESSLETEAVLSVCSGAFVLAKCGLLDDIEATTWYGAIDALRREAPKTKVHAGRRLVDSGDIVTAAGVSAGIDGALHLVSRLCGSDIARNTAKYMEYHWLPEFDQGYVDYVRDTGITEQTRPLVDEFIAGIEQRLAAGRFDAGEITADERWLFIHEQPKFREAIKRWVTKSSATLAPPDEPGERLHVSGVVKDGDGKPIEGAIIYAYHTDKGGIYSSAGGNTGTQGDSLNPKLFGFMKTGADGKYEYRTIKPGHYPGNSPPAHVHLELSAPGHERLFTELMFESDPKLDKASRREVEESGFVVAPEVKKDGEIRCVCDLVMKKEKKGR
ncbi:MAG TPA: DJ-1/PfpI family protein [Phycisphaerae bacterium]|nr:DJ-1/PfpI family protein [Phycisphaerae bacterium]